MTTKPRFPRATWIAPALVLAVLSASGPALAISVIVNGRPLPDYPPAVQRSGRVLLPMRMIFEALGAQVKWEAATQTAIGVRGDTTVRMSIGDRRAWINERVVLLDVAPQLIGGSTYMPVRFPAEAFGANVGWQGATQTVEISLAPLAEPPEEPVQPPPPPPEPVEPPPTQPGEPTPPPEPPPQPGRAVGVVEAVRTTGLGSIALKVEDDLVVYNVVEDTIILRQGRQASLGDVQPGDQAEVRHDGRGNAVVVQATYEELRGQIAAKAGNKLLLEDGRLLVLRPTVRVVGPDGEELKLADLKPGDEVVLHLTPGTDSVGRVERERAPVEEPVVEPAEPETQPPPQIDLFFHEEEEPLRAGDVLEVTLVGTPNGEAWFDIGDKVEHIELREARRQRGTYQVEWVIPDDVNAIGVNLYGHLEVEGQEAEVAQSEEPVVIDTTPPTIGEVAPEDGTILRNSQPNILALIDDANGSGVAEATLELFVNNRRRELTYRATRRFLSAVPAPLPDGEVEVIATVMDEAGNRAEKSWFFIVQTGGAPAIAVRHDAGEPLRPGETLQVSLTGPAGGTATFDVGDLALGIEMTENALDPGRYDGVYRVPFLAEGREVDIVGHLVTAGGQELTGEATAAVTFLPGELPAPTISVPREGQTYRQRTLAVEGESIPLARVKLKLEYTAKGRITGLPYAGVLADTEVATDAEGDFRSDPISLTVPVLLPRDVRYKLTVVAVGPADEESEPTVVNFLPGR